MPALMDAWNYAIRPTLADLKGDAWIYSTPKGRNGFWQMFQWGADPERADWRSWQLPSSVNPLIAPSELEEMRRSFPERVWQQEMLAQFLEDAGGVFRRVMEAAKAPVQERREHNGQYLFGVDFARDADFTVIAVWDVDRKQLCHLDRFNQIDYTVQLARLNGLYERFKPAAIVAEANSMGGPLVEFMRRSGLPVRPFTTTNATKAQVIEALALGFEQGAFQIIPDPVLIAELQAYELERLPSGLIRYGAPNGMHDDAVIAAALAYYAASAPPKRVRSREY